MFWVAAEFFAPGTQKSVVILPQMYYTIVQGKVSGSGRSSCIFPSHREV